MISPSAFIHDLAHVEGATVGPRTRIWQFASVIRGAWLGADCNVGSCAIIDAATVGDGSTVGHGVSLNPGIWLMEKVFVGPNVTFCNDFWPSVSKDGFDLDQFLKPDWWTTLVCDGASIGAGATILPGVVVGVGAMVAAGAVVDRSIADNHLFRRDGKIVSIDGQRARRRMIRAQPLISGASA